MSQRILERLAQHYPLLIRTEHHVQIQTAKGYHDIWFGKEGTKVKFCGSRRVQPMGADRLMAELRAYSYGESDLADMQALHKLIDRAAETDGIFVDAGWKNGKAKVAVIRKQGTAIDVHVRSVEAATCTEAEERAIAFAARCFPDPTAPIYSDCQAAVEKFKPRAVWLPRNANKDADKLANVRGTNGKGASHG